MTLKQHRRQHSIKLDGCFGGKQRGIDCSSCTSRIQCDKLTTHRRKMAKKWEMV